MKLIIFLLILGVSLETFAEDCKKVYLEMDSSIDSMEALLNKSLSQELTTLDNIFNPKVLGPHLPFIENNKVKFFSELIPLRRKINTEMIKMLKAYSVRLKNCSRDLNECGHEINTSSRKQVKPRRIEVIQDKIQDTITDTLQK